MPPVTVMPSVPASVKLPVPVSWLAGRLKADNVVIVELEDALMFPAVKLDAVPVMFVPTKAEGVPRAGVTRVGLVASTTAPEPVVVAAEIAVPLPCRMPVMVVESVMAGVVVAVATVPASPLADTTETEVTVPEVAGEAQAGEPATIVRTCVFEPFARELSRPAELLVTRPALEKLDRVRAPPSVLGSEPL